MIKRQKIDIDHEVFLKLPVDARVIDFAPGRSKSFEDEYIDMWYDDPGQSEGEMTTYWLKIRGTGMNSPGVDSIHLKTLVFPSGLVWHLYVKQNQ